MANTHEEKGWGEGERGEVSPRAPDLEASRLGSAKSKWGTGSTLMIWSTVRTLLRSRKQLPACLRRPARGLTSLPFSALWPSQVDSGSSKRLFASALALGQALRDWISCFSLPLLSASPHCRLHRYQTSPPSTLATGHSTDRRRLTSSRSLPRSPACQWGRPLLLLLRPLLYTTLLLPLSRCLRQSTNERLCAGSSGPSSPSSRSGSIPCGRRPRWAASCTRWRSKASTCVWRASADTLRASFSCSAPGPSLHS